MEKEAYKKYVEGKTPKNNVWLNMLKAFVLGGGICLVGQVIMNLCLARDMEKDIASSWTSIFLVYMTIYRASSTPISAIEVALLPSISISGSRRR